ncbi:hypothetical protein AAG565_02920 [Fontimonas sp. SYSU GA230001]|uniref:DUF6933 domain-containing protein n=1 Tax=Fontimonas sp. SYSU GA230001 TaxID=3142450 RepID=UPI0032B56E8F
MTVLRCTAKLLKRLRQPAKLPEPPAADNPLGEWYADIDFIDREPFALLLNAATGATLVLPARAADLRDLHVHAGQQLFKLFAHFGLDPQLPLVGAELRAWEAPPTCANTRDRSLLGSLNRLRFEAWHHFAYRNRSLPEAAAQQWDGLFRHPSLVQDGRRYGHHAWQRPVDLVRARLLVPADVHSSVRTLH